jgi:hypothetical protein
MCTTISDKAPVAGSGKGADGWFALDHVYVGYDHPYHAPFEHSVNIDFVSEQTGPGARVAVELSREDAKTLATRILATLDEAEAYEAG